MFHPLKALVRGYSYNATPYICIVLDASSDHGSAYLSSVTIVGVGGKLESVSTQQITVLGLAEPDDFESVRFGKTEFK